MTFNFAKRCSFKWETKSPESEFLKKILLNFSMNSDFPFDNVIVLQECDKSKSYSFLQMKFFFYLIHRMLLLNLLEISFIFTAIIFHIKKLITFCIKKKVELIWRPWGIHFVDQIQMWHYGGQCFRSQNEMILHRNIRSPIVEFRKLRGQVQPRQKWNRNRNSGCKMAY